MLTSPKAKFPSYGQTAATLFTDCNIKRRLPSQTDLLVWTFSWVGNNAIEGRFGNNGIYHIRLLFFFYYCCLLCTWRIIHFLVLMAHDVMCHDCRWVFTLQQTFLPRCPRWYNWSITDSKALTRPSCGWFSPGLCQQINLYRKGLIWNLKKLGRKQNHLLTLSISLIPTVCPKPIISESGQISQTFDIYSELRLTVSHPLS